MTIPPQTFLNQNDRFQNPFLAGSYFVHLKNLSQDSDSGALTHTSTTSNTEL